MVEPDDERARQLSITIADATEQGVARGKLSLDQAADVTAAVRRVRSIGELESGLGLIIETVPERLALKQAVLTEIDGRHPSIIATNTSALSIDVLAGGVKNPSTFLGMHFFNPVWSLPMVELVLGAATSAATVDRQDARLHRASKRASAPYVPAVRDPGRIDRASSNRISWRRWRRRTARRPAPTAIR